MDRFVGASRESFALPVRTILGKKFRGLWTKAGMYDDLDRVCRSIRNIGFWREGWIGVKETLRFDGAGMARAKPAFRNAAEWER
jgi:hypothetical protein